MKIREVESLTGLKKTNIRFYEEEGLVSPNRNTGNNYREYTVEDVESLRRIKLLRVLGVSIGDIRRFQKEETDLSGLMEMRKQQIAEDIRALEEVRVRCDFAGKMEVSFYELDPILLDMRSEIFRIKGEKIMRLDQIRYLEGYQKAFEKIGCWACFVYVIPMQILHFICEVELPVWFHVAGIILGVVIPSVSSGGISLAILREKRRKN